MAKILLVDDREDNLMAIESILTQDGYTFVKATSGREALKVLLSEYDFALILMDVKMPNLNGFETASLIYEREKLKHIPIIFITAHDQYAVNSFELGVTDYLLKPVSFERFLKAANKVRIQIENQRHPASAVNNNAYPGYFFIRANNKLVKILYKDVYYIESAGDYIKVYTTDLPLLSYSSMKMIESKLPPGLFIRIHSGYIVSINAVKAVNGQLLELLNGTCLPIAKSRKEHLFSALRIEES